MARTSNALAFAVAVLALAGVPHTAGALTLRANFNLLGEVNRTSTLGLGTLLVRVAIDDVVLATGTIVYNVGDVPPLTTGVFLPVSLPSTGPFLLSIGIPVEFDMEVGQQLALLVFMNAGGASIEWDFNSGSNGFVLTSLTRSDGVPLSLLGLSIDVIEANAWLRVFATNGGVQEVEEVVPPASISVSPGVGAVSTAAVTENPFLINLTMFPEPLGTGFDSADAEFKFTRLFGDPNPNIELVQGPVVPVASPLGLVLLGLALGSTALVAMLRRRGWTRRRPR